MRLRPRYFVVLLWHWSLPFVLGSMFGLSVCAWQLRQMGPQIEASFRATAEQVCHADR